jgi:hypothetical protein
MYGSVTLGTERKLFGAGVMGGVVVGGVVDMTVPVVASAASVVTLTGAAVVV